MALRTFHYSIVSFVPDIGRGEAANVGVIVVDDTTRTGRGKFLSDISTKVVALAPGFNVAGIANALDRLQAQIATPDQPDAASVIEPYIQTSAHLRTLAGAMKNQIQMSEPRVMRAHSLDAAADELYRLMVRPVGKTPADTESNTGSVGRSSGLLTVVEDFVIAAMKRAVPELLNNGMIAATIAECPGVVAFGADNHECATELYARLEDWVKASLSSGFSLPVIDGIDLNAEAGRILATYHTGYGPAIGGEFYADAEELEAAFEERSKPG
jgi:hypothetical protein